MTPSFSPYSGHASRQSLEIYSRLVLADTQQAYDQTIGRSPDKDRPSWRTATRSGVPGRHGPARSSSAASTAG
jgi:hypothetical protein